MIPYGRQLIDEEDIKAVVEVLRSDWLTTGPKVTEFEEAVANYVGVQEAVAVSSGTAALHSAMYALGIGPGDEVIVPSMTFAATANSVVFQGGTPVFVDVEADTLLLDTGKVEEKISENTKAVIAVDFAGQPCEYDALRELCNQHGLVLVADGCHALGAEYKGEKVGSLADMTVFSFHPVKHITTGEGGMITTNKRKFAEKIRIFRNHGINTEFQERELQGSWYYEMVDLGYNYRISDILCGLGLSQLRKLSHFLERRRETAARYDQAFSSLPKVEPLRTRKDILHAYHLYVIKKDFSSEEGGRSGFFQKMLKRGIRINVHYIPVHLHPFYRRRFGTGPGLCAVAETEYERIVSLPIYPAIRDSEVQIVIEAVREFT